MSLFGRLSIVALLLLVPPAFAQESVRSAPEQAVPPPARPIAPAEENSHYGWADVLRVDPVYADETENSQPTAPCYEEQVPVPPADADAQDKRGIFTAIGAFVGGILGNQFGKGKGKVATTAAGAVAGGVAGNNIAATDAAGDQRPQYTSVRHCPAAPQRQRKTAGYDVEYRYRGDVYTSHMTYDPGDRLRVRVSVTPTE